MVVAVVAAVAIVVVVTLVRVLGNVATGRDGLPRFVSVEFVSSQPEASLRFPGSAQLFRFNSDTTDLNLPKFGAFVSTGLSAPGSADAVIAWYVQALSARGWQQRPDTGSHTPRRHIFVRGREMFILQLYPDVADPDHFTPAAGTVIYETTLSIESCSGAPQYC